MKMIRLTLAALAGALLLSFAQPRSSADDAAAIAKQIPFYPASTCVVSGESLMAMGGALDVLHEGRLVRLCCKGCMKPFQKNPAEFVAKIDAMAKAKQIATYPTDKCLVSDEPLAAMGGPLDLMVQGRLVRVCCKGCKKPVNKNPESFFAKIDAELIKTQKAAYPLDKCVVTGAVLGADAVDHLYGSHLVRLANADALATFTKAPERHVMAVEAAWAAKAKAGAESAGHGKDGDKGHKKGHEGHGHD